MWKSEVDCVSPYAGGASTASKSLNTQQIEQGKPMLLLCGYGVEWGKNEKQFVLNEWKPEIGVTPLHTIPVPCFANDNVASRLEQTLEEYGGPPIILLFGTGDSNVTVLRHSKRDSEVQDIEWKQKWLKNYITLRVRRSLVEEMYFFAERWAGIISQFHPDNVPAIDIKDATRLLFRIGDFVACYISNIPNAEKIVNEVFSGINRNCSLNLPEFLAVNWMVIYDLLHTAIVHSKIVAKQQTA